MIGFVYFQDGNREEITCIKNYYGGNVVEFFTKNGHYIYHSKITKIPFYCEQTGYAIANEEFFEIYFSVVNDKYFPFLQPHLRLADIDRIEITEDSKWVM